MIIIATYRNTWTFRKSSRRIASLGRLTHHFWQWLLKTHGFFTSTVQISGWIHGDFTTSLLMAYLTTHSMISHLDHILILKVPNQEDLSMVHAFISLRQVLSVSALMEQPQIYPTKVDAVCVEDHEIRAFTALIVTLWLGRSFTYIMWIQRGHPWNIIWPPVMMGPVDPLKTRSYPTCLSKCL